MSILIAAVLFAIAFSFLAIQNNIGVPVNLLGFIWPAVPLYVVALVSLLVGLGVAWVFSLIGWISTSFTMQGKNAHIRRTENTVAQLQDRIHQLEIDNARLRDEKHEIKEDAREEIADTRHEFRPSIMDRLRHAF
jgi:uncharacterized integral membrane protein